MSQLEQQPKPVTGALPRLRPLEEDRDATAAAPPAKTARVANPRPPQPTHLPPPSVPVTDLRHQVQFPAASIGGQTLTELSHNYQESLTPALKSADVIRMNKEHKPCPRGQYVDITDLLTMPEKEAAAQLGIPESTLSKRWREVTQGRKWPFRSVAAIDKKILTLLRNTPMANTSGNLSPRTETILQTLLSKRQSELTPVVIRL